MSTELNREGKERINTMNRLQSLWTTCDIISSFISICTFYIMHHWPKGIIGPIQSQILVEIYLESRCWCQYQRSTADYVFITSWKTFEQFNSTACNQLYIMAINWYKERLLPGTSAAHCGTRTLSGGNIVHYKTVKLQRPCPKVCSFTKTAGL